MLQKLLVFSVFILLAGCAAPPTRAPYVPAASTSPPTAQTTVHPYRVRVVDFAGAPLAGVRVSLKAENDHTPTKTEECVTDEKGNCPVFSYTVNRNPRLTYVTSYISKLSAEASLNGYYNKKGTTASTAGSMGTTASTLTGELVLRMVRPVDYLEDSLASSSADRELRNRVLAFLDVIRAQGYLNEGEVALKGIGISEFKGKKYLRVKVNSTTTYNKLKLDKYGVGKALFDETVRKMLNPLNDAIAAPKAFFGYDLIVIGLSKSFADKDAVAEKTEYRFLMPETVVRRYKDKDISGQALLDASVLLLDDERIELKLQ